jgi:septal ring factor EnvC (AmiA/AmiB activator)
MSNKDYFDDDLIQRRDAVKEVKMGPASEAAAAPATPRSEPVPVEELNLTPLTQRKEEINSQVATKLDELERLRARQEALEREKSSLEHLRASQEKYETGKREMIDHLEQSLVALERQEVLVNQRLELLAETEKHFKELLAGVRGFTEEQWPTDSNGYREELTKALAIVDNARKEYNKALARVDVLGENRGAGLEGKPLLYDEMLGQSVRQRSFGEWLKIGFAVSLPVAVVLAALIAVLLIKFS